MRMNAWNYLFAQEVTGDSPRKVPSDGGNGDPIDDPRDQRVPVRVNLVKKKYEKQGNSYFN